MNRLFFCSTLWLLSPSLLLLQPQFLPAAEAVAEKDKIDFLKQIKPLFQTKCYSCHGREVQEGGFRLDLKSRALEGGDSGRAI
ncbi:MAG TPA: hypothetical protein DCM07_05975, partial [Planctomycetaceae bacterium]|nr:hypothetical protein [Planctomycetaceae bacterium]